MDLNYRGELNGDKRHKGELFYLNADERRCVCVCIYKQERLKRSGDRT